MTNLGKMMKQAQELQGRMADLKEQLAQLEITGAAAGGMVAAAAGLSEGAGRDAVAMAMTWVYGINAVFAVLALAMIVPMLLARRRTAAI